MTTIALREMGVAVYAGGRFVQIRASKDRRPGSEQDEAGARRKSRSWCGSVTWREAGDRWIGRHEVLDAKDVRIQGSALESTASFDGDDASVRMTLPDGTSRQERWRRLSGAGSHPLAGAWESRGSGEHWLYLVTAGHYAVMRALDDRAAPDHAGELDDQEFLAMVAGYGVNAGAHVSGNSTLDHWPFIGGPAGYEARKHPSFRYRFTDEGRLELQLHPFTDYEGASTWQRAT